MRRFRPGPGDEQCQKADVAAVQRSSAQVGEGGWWKGGVPTAPGCTQAAAEPAAGPVVSTEILKIKQRRGSWLLKIRLLLSCLCTGRAALLHMDAVKGRNQTPTRVPGRERP